MLASCLVALLGSASGLAPALAPPRSYWRFEDPANFGADSSPGGHNPLRVTKNTTAAYQILPHGVVGSYLSVNGTSTAAAVVAAGGAWGCAGQGCAGSTVELLLRAKRFINIAGETSLISSHGGGSAFGYDLRLGRHSLGFHTGSDPAFPDQDIPGWDVIAELEGVGIASPANLFDGNWHHFAFVQNGAASAPNCSVAVWLDGARPAGGLWSSNSSAAALHRPSCALLLTEPIIFLPDALDAGVGPPASSSSSSKSSLPPRPSSSPPPCLFVPLCLIALLCRHPCAYFPSFPPLSRH